ncbi:hypothetical protein ATO67_13725 [Agrobacterium bohemicum]|uniref:Uncharacterized protein n=1 Tax=Agrobacterium bohemicum TaxID=2052828 RepID=A0A135NY13_9HYPH|nr:hypothetical protein ATO67_13725 [Agrobacterium bohemicum]
MTEGAVPNGRAWSSTSRASAADRFVGGVLAEAGQSGPVGDGAGEGCQVGAHILSQAPSSIPWVSNGFCRTGVWKAIPVKTEMLFPIEMKIILAEHGAPVMMYRPEPETEDKIGQ